MKLSILMFALVTLGAAPSARAAEGEPEAPPLPTARAQDNVEAGLFLASTVAAKVGVAPAVASVLSGYDSARSSATFTATTDVHLWGPIALRVGATYSPQTPSERDLQPQVGLRVQILDQQKHGIDAAAGVMLKRERYSQDGGELVALAMLGRRLGRLGLFANAAYGQDPEGDDRDGFVSLAALYAVNPHLQLGLDGRLRFDLDSTDTRRAARRESNLDLMVGPTATVPLGSLALMAQVGYSAIKLGDLRSGVLALGGLGWAF
jgi:hypothetical protein